MATAHINEDAIALLISGDHTNTDPQLASNSLGGTLTHREVTRNAAHISGALVSVAVLQIAGNNSTGNGYISATTVDTLTYTAPGDTAGAAVTIAAGETKILQSATTTEWIRVYRDRDGLDLDGDLTLDIINTYNSLHSFRDITTAEQISGATVYRAGFIANYSGETVSNLKAYLNTLGTQATSDGGQLGASGSGTITTTGTLADWPDAGWCRIVDSGGTLREIVYYTSRTTTVLTVPSAGRGLLDTSAAAGAASDTLDAVPGMALGYEVPDSDGAIQTIASDTTAPSAITWSTEIGATNAISLSNLYRNTAQGLWLRLEIPAGATYTTAQQNAITVQHEYDSTTYTDAINGYYRIADAAQDRYEVWVGEDAAPDLSAAADATGALTLSVAVANPSSGTKDINVTTRKRNDIGLLSQNSEYSTVTIDSGGNDVTKVLSTPTGLTLTAQPASEILIEATYNAGADVSPADTWNVYLTTTGVDPDITTDTPTQYTMSASGTPGDIDGSFPSGGTGSSFTLSEAVGPYNWGDDVRVVVTAERSSDSEESAGTAVVQHTVDNVVLGVPGCMTVLAGEQYINVPAVAMFDETETLSAGVYFRSIPGETQFWSGSTLIWRALWLSSGVSRLYIDDSWALSNVTHSAAGTSDDVEVVSANEIYLNVNSTRRVKIDVSAKTIEADSFEAWEGTITYDTRAATGWPATGSTTSQMWMEVYDPAACKLREYIEVDTAGKLLTESPIIQELG